VDQGLRKNLSWKLQMNYRYLGEEEQLGSGDKEDQPARVREEKRVYRKKDRPKHYGSS
jgi:hypothetical protein